MNKIITNQLQSDNKELRAKLRIEKNIKNNLYSFLIENDLMNSFKEYCKPK